MCLSNTLDILPQLPSVPEVMRWPVTIWLWYLLNVCVRGANNFTKSRTCSKTNLGKQSWKKFTKILEILEKITKISKILEKITKISKILEKITKSQKTLRFLKSQKSRTHFFLKLFVPHLSVCCSVISAQCSGDLDYPLITNYKLNYLKLINFVSRTLLRLKVPILQMTCQNTGPYFAISNIFGIVSLEIKIAYP